MTSYGPSLETIKSIILDFQESRLESGVPRRSAVLQCWPPPCCEASVTRWSRRCRLAFWSTPAICLRTGSLRRRLRPRVHRPPPGGGRVLCHGHPRGSDRRRPACDAASPCRAAVVGTVLARTALRRSPADSGGCGARNSPAGYRSRRWISNGLGILAEHKPVMRRSDVRSSGQSDSGERQN